MKKLLVLFSLILFVGVLTSFVSLSQIGQTDVDIGNHKNMVSTEMQNNFVFLVNKVSGLYTVKKLNKDFANLVQIQRFSCNKYMAQLKLGNSYESKNVSISKFRKARDAL